MTPGLKVKMRRFKADTIREDGRLERHCIHCVGHTVAHVNSELHTKQWGDYIGSHGCDGCCEGWPVEWED